MLRYKNFATTTISVDLMNDYSVIAMANWNNATKKYNVTFYIKRNDIDMLDLIERVENLEFDSDIKSIKSDISTYITTLLTEGFFDYYIKRYEYEQKCFDKGNELFEQERLGGK